MVLYNVTILGTAGKDSPNVPWSYVEGAIANLVPGQACRVVPVNAPHEVRWYGDREAIAANKVGTLHRAAESDLSAKNLAAMERDGNVGPRHDRGQKG